MAGGCASYDRSGWQPSASLYKTSRQIGCSLLPHGGHGVKDNLAIAVERDRFGQCEWAAGSRRVPSGLDRTGEYFGSTDRDRRVWVRRRSGQSFQDRDLKSDARCRGAALVALGRLRNRRNRRDGLLHQSGWFHFGIGKSATAR